MILSIFDLQWPDARDAHTVEALVEASRALRWKSAGAWIHEDGRVLVKDGNLSLRTNRETFLAVTASAPWPRHEWALEDSVAIYVPPR
jgi:hypothetical protein